MRLLKALGLLALLATPANADVQFFFNIPGIGIVGGGGGGYPPPPPYPPQYAPQYPIYGGYYYYKGDYPQYAPYPRYPGGVVAGGGYYDGYQGGYGYKKNRYKKRWKAPPEDYPVPPEVDHGGGYRPPPGCNKPPMCTGGKPWRPRQ